LERNRILLNTSLVYSFIFFAFGTLYPLLSLFFVYKGISGRQLGLLLSVGPFIAIIFQPLWGFYCDLKKKPNGVIIFALVMAAGFSLLFTVSHSYWVMLILIILLTIFQCAVMPILDKLSLNVAELVGSTYGRIRLWGSTGYAVAAMIASVIVGLTSITLIFYIYSLMFLMSSLLVRNIPNTEIKMKNNIFKGLKKLISEPQLILFIFSAILIYGPISSNSYFLGLLFEDLKSSTFSIGLAFLLFSLSEIPVMFYSGKLLNYFGSEKVLIFAALLSAVRWFWYGLLPSPTMIISLFLLHGLTVGLYITAAIKLLRKISSEHLQTTSISIFTSVGMGFGSVICNFLGWDNYRKVFNR